MTFRGSPELNENVTGIIPTPRFVAGLIGIPISVVSAGELFTAVLTRSGEVRYARC